MKLKELKNTAGQTSVGLKVKSESLNKKKSPATKRYIKRHAAAMQALFLINKNEIEDIQAITKRLLETA